HAYRHTHHPEQHPFPTRRSSDLEAEGDELRPIAGGRGMNVEELVVHAARLHNDPLELSDPNSEATNMTPNTELQQTIRARLGEIDRKSTRLNSSHEWISYAVFCL